MTCPTRFFGKNRPYDACTGVSEERWAEIKEKFPHFPDCLDITARRREAFIRLPAFAEEWAVKTFLKDPRDGIMVSTLANIVLSVIPMTALVFYHPSHWLGALSYMFRFIFWL